jgi:hypothetical protein
MASKLASRGSAPKNKIKAHFRDIKATTKGIKKRNRAIQI